MKRLLHIILLVGGLWLLAPGAAAQPTQEEVFRSIGRNVSQPADSRRVLAVALGIAGVVALLVVISHSKQRDGGPRPLNHQGKLLKEAMKAVPLKPAELKQLKTLVQEARARDENGPESPLTLLLCPSVLAREAQRSPQKVNRKVLAGLLKRMGFARAG